MAAKKAVTKKAAKAAKPAAKKESKPSTKSVAKAPAKKKKNVDDDLEMIGGMDDDDFSSDMDLNIFNDFEDDDDF